jgi:NAD(P)-dependent dehydrogenase (short-subunit alcohol dehydrogenase family)
MRVNLKGYFLCSQAVGRQMIERKKGTIINIASRLGMKVVPFVGAYCVAKASELMLTRMLAVELAKDKYQGQRHCPGHSADRGA